MISLFDVWTRYNRRPREYYLFRGRWYMRNRYQVRLPWKGNTSAHVQNQAYEEHCRWVKSVFRDCGTHCTNKKMSHDMLVMADWKPVYGKSFLIQFRSYIDKATKYANEAIPYIDEELADLMSQVITKDIHIADRRDNLLSTFRGVDWWTNNHGASYWRVRFQGKGAGPAHYFQSEMMAALYYDHIIKQKFDSDITKLNFYSGPYVPPNIKIRRDCKRHLIRVNLSPDLIKKYTGGRDASYLVMKDIDRLISYVPQKAIDEYLNQRRYGSKKT